MRERTRLEESIGRYRRLEAALNDNIELIEMGEAEGDGDIVSEAEAALRAARNEAAEAALSQIDRRMQEDRWDGKARRQRHFAAELASMPDGAMVGLPLEPGIALLVWGGTLLEWSGSGYHSCRRRPADLQVQVLTPRSSVAALAAGYRPMLHPTAAALIEACAD